MRRPLAILAALALLAIIPAGVNAGKATKEVDHFVGINCDGIAPVSGSGFLFLGVSISDTFGPGGGLDMWNTSSPDGPPDITSDFEAPVDASYVGGVFSALLLAAVSCAVRSPQRMLPVAGMQLILRL